MQVSDWLRQLNLEQYTDAFTTNAVDWTVLPTLTADDLREIGVSAVGDRRKLLNAIAELAGSGAVPSPTPAASERRAPSVGPERRQLTVMFCDLVGSTPLAARFDPEDLRDIVGAYHRAVAETAARSSGFVAKYMGDGVLIYFGYPEAHEDDAERAARAGLALVDAVAALEAPEPLQVRVGIASGLVVVGDLIGEGAAQERGVVGETPNLAARLQVLAAPGTVVVADATRRQLGALFDLEDLGPQPLAGFAEAQHAWRILRESGVASRFEALRSGATPLVGRDEELDLLLRRWQQAKTGAGRVVLISGEPGIGKSRLSAALSEHISAEPHIRLRHFCSPHRQDSALYPFAAQLERAAGFARDDTPGQKLGKLEALIASSAGDPDEVTLIAELLSLPNNAAELDLSPQKKREQLFTALLGQLEALARSDPVLMVFEDVHWTDPTSREALDLIVDRLRTLPVLLLITFRPEFQPPWAGQPHVTMLALNRLGERDGSALVEQLAGNAGVSSELIAEIVERTDGIPLFIEELTKSVVETGTYRGDASLASVPPASLAVPATLHASLLGRLDRLGPSAKTVAQAGAAMGRDFSYDLVMATAGLPEPELNDALRLLVESGLVFQRGQPPTAEYLFKHALVQDTAYSTLLRTRRRELHDTIAELLESRFTDRIEANPELVAHHYSEAGRPDPAAVYWQRAGERALQRSANQEAINHLTAGLAQLARLLPTPDQATRELAMQRLLGQATFAARGYASPEAGQVYGRARELCAAVGDDRSVCPVLLGVWLFEYGGGDHRRASATARECLVRADRSGDNGASIVGRCLAAISALHLGELNQARSDFDAAIILYRSISEDYARHIAAEYGLEFGSPVFGFAAWCVWLLGYPDTALRLADEALANAERVRHDFTRSRGLFYNSAFHAFRRDWPTAEARAAAARALAEDRGHAMMAAVGRIMHTAARAILETRADGVAELRQAITAYRATGARSQTTHYLALLAQLLSASGKHDEGLATLHEAAALVKETGERYVEAEINRLKGELLLAQQGASAAAEAEAAYETAVKVARAQQCRSFELRAATSLAHLLDEQGRRAEARELLAPVHDWFTEGFDTADLKEAKTLLAELV